MTDRQWTDTRAGIEEATSRLVDVICDADDLGRNAVGEWNLAETVSHVGMAASFDAYVVTGEIPTSSAVLAAKVMRTASFDDLARYNAEGLAGVSVTDRGEVADQVKTRVDELLDKTVRMDGTERVTWLGGVQLTSQSVLGHLLQELLVHGFDIAHAASKTWKIPPYSAALSLESFMFEVVRNLDGTALAASTRCPPVRAEFDLDFTKAVVMASDGDRLGVEEPGGKIDVRLSGDPATALLMIFGRINPLPAVLRRNVGVTGPRPWRLRRLQQLAP